MIQWLSISTPTHGCTHGCSVAEVAGLVAHALPVGNSVAETACADTWVGHEQELHQRAPFKLRVKTGQVPAGAMRRACVAWMLQCGGAGSRAGLAPAGGGVWDKDAYGLSLLVVLFIGWIISINLFTLFTFTYGGSGQGV